MSKLTGLHSIFRKKSIYRANIGFHTLTFAMSLGRCRCLKARTTYQTLIEGHLIIPVYMDDVLRSVVLLFCAKTSDSTGPKMTMPEHTSLESAKTMLCALTGQFAHQTVHDNFGQRVQRILMASRNPKLFDAVLQEILMRIPQHQTSIQSMRNQ